MSDRKRSKGLRLEDLEEAGKPKKQKLEDYSSHSEQEISVHARQDEDDFLYSPESASERSYSPPLHGSESSPERQEELEAFPLIKIEGGGEERKKVRRYRGGVDSHDEQEKEMWGKKERERKRRAHSHELEERTRHHHRREKHSSRASPQYYESERLFRNRGDRCIHSSRERSFKGRLDDLRERDREDNRRALYPRDLQKRHHSKDPKDRAEYHDVRKGDRRDVQRWRDERDRHPQRDHPARSEHRPIGDRLEFRERHQRFVRPSREQESYEHGRVVAKEKVVHERHHDRHREHHREDSRPEKVQKRRSPLSGESGSDTDESTEKKHQVSEKIEDLIKELEEGEDVSSSGSERSERKSKERVSGDSNESEGEVVDGTSDISDDDDSDSKPHHTEITLARSASEKMDIRHSTSPTDPNLPKTEPGVMRSKFDVDDDDDEEEGEMRTKQPQRKGYSGYEAFSSSEEEEEAAEELHTDKSEEASEEVDEEPEESPEPELPPYLPALMGCRNVENYEWLNRIEEGTYGVVYRAKDKRTGQIVALKKLKMEKEKEGFPITSLREINMLLKAKHPNIVHVREIVVGSNMDKIYIVMDYVEHDLKSLMETMKQPFLEGEVKTLTIQLLRAVHHLHDNWILHRDLKASNLLLSHKGILKVGDFGLAREYGSPLKPYTPVVVTLWYRTPELLLGVKEYSTAVDMWSVGCIFAEFLLHKPLFQGKSEIDQLNQIFKELGTPSEEIWPGYNQLPFVKKVSFTKQPYNHLRKRFPYLTQNGFDLLNRFLTFDPKKRITAEKALKHEYFKESPLPVDPSMFPTWPARSEMARNKRERSPQAPQGGAFKFNKEDESDEVTGFRLTQAQHGQAAVGAGFSLKF